MDHVRQFSGLVHLFPITSADSGPGRAQATTTAANSIVLAGPYLQSGFSPMSYSVNARLCMTHPVPLIQWQLLSLWKCPEGIGRTSEPPPAASEQYPSYTRSSSLYVMISHRDPGFLPVHPDMVSAESLVDMLLGFQVNARYSSDSSSP